MPMRYLGPEEGGPVRGLEHEGDAYTDFDGDLLVEAPAREFFGEVRRAHGRIEELTSQIECGFPPARSGGPAAPGYKADPVGARVAEMMDREADAERELEQLEDLVGEARGVCDGVRAYLGDRYGEVLERHYVDAVTWGEVAAAIGVTERWCRHLRDVALDYVDSVGTARASRGEAP